MRTNADVERNHLSSNNAESLSFLYAAPVRTFIGAAFPQIKMPAEAVNWLSTHAAESWSAEKAAAARRACGADQPHSGAVVPILPPARAVCRTHLPRRQKCRRRTLRRTYPPGVGRMTGDSDLYPQRPRAGLTGAAAFRSNSAAPSARWRGSCWARRRHRRIYSPFRWTDYSAACREVAVTKLVARDSTASASTISRRMISATGRTSLMPPTVCPAVSRYSC
jgi:hypothetical protein